MGENMDDRLTKLSGWALAFNGDDLGQRLVDEGLATR